jgi:hypothetical protein
MEAFHVELTVFVNEHVTLGSAESHGNQTANLSTIVIQPLAVVKSVINHISQMRNDNNQPTTNKHCSKVTQDTHAIPFGFMGF